MKKILSTIVAALVAVSFAGFVFAFEPPPIEGAPGSQQSQQQMNTDAAGNARKVEKAPVKKTKETTKKEVKKEKDTAAPLSENQ